MENNINVIVFDNMTITKVRIRQIFESQGIRVNEAMTSDEIISTITKYEDYSHVILINTNYEIEEDIFEILKKIRNEHPKVPIVILTSKAQRGFFVRCVCAGASDYILKPFKDHFLSERVLQLLKNDDTISRMKAV